jgi:hypothetical protein
LKSINPKFTITIIGLLKMNLMEGHVSKILMIAPDVLEDKDKNDTKGEKDNAKGALVFK